MERLGGLARRMPLTWLGFVIGAAAIVGLPPFNGFVSEWLVYQGMFTGADSSRSLRLALVGLPALALIGALALACFAKVAGVTFLGAARSDRAESASEHAGGYGPVLALAAACVTLGVVPMTGMSLVAPAARALVGVPGVAVPESVATAAWTISLVAAGTMLMVAVLWIARARVQRGQVRQAATWGCAYPAVSPRMQYTASSFAAPLVAVFGRLSGVAVERGPRTLHTRARDLLLDGAALPAWHAVHRVALRLRVAQHGRLQLYLLYVMGALLAMLAWLSLGYRR
jgi:NADH:ubiquinone oxidoreductase subunit 5 (subunit L)/multisubunit Na+/H+ antiporter MnhA subunit